MRIYETQHVQVPDKDDPRGYRYQATKKREVLYDKETEEHKPKKGARWIRIHPRKS